MGYADPTLETEETLNSSMVERFGVYGRDEDLK